MQLLEALSDEDLMPHGREFVLLDKIRVTTAGSTICENSFKASAIITDWTIKPIMSILY